MNTYHRYCPNVWLAKTKDEHKKGDTIFVANKYGKEAEHKVHNLIFSKDGFNYYSIERLGESYAERRAEKLRGWSESNKEKSDEYWKKSNKHRDFLKMGEPIKVGHHSEGRHRKMINNAWSNAGKSVELQDKAEEQIRKAEYWENRAKQVNLSDPECLEFFEYRLERLEQIRKEYKDGTREQEHAYSLSYLSKDIRDIKKKIEIAKVLWGEK